ncbi:COPIA protein, partial [Acromyrmex heyeri]
MVEGSGERIMEFESFKLKKVVYIPELSKNLLWHRKLGHIGYDNIKDFIKINQGLVLSSAELNPTQKVCKICMEAKHLRTKFNTAKIKAKRPLQIIYTDLCGLISPNSLDSKKYFIFFMDDYTHFVMVYLFKSNQEQNYRKKDKRVYGEGGSKREFKNCQNQM